MRASPWMLLLSLSACADKDEQKETGTPETGDTGSEETGQPQETGDTGPSGLVYALTIEDYTSHDGLAGVTFTTDAGATATTDDDGEVEFDLPYNRTTVATASIDGYPDLREVFQVDLTWPDFTQRQYYANQDAVGTTFDAAKGHLVVDITSYQYGDDGGPDREELPGATISISLDAEVTLATSGTVAGGLTPGDTTIGGGSSGTAIYFVNVEPGTATLTVDAGEEWSCSLGPGTEVAESWEIDVLADTTTRLLLMCR